MSLPPELILVLIVLGFAVYELVNIRRQIREDREKRAREQGEGRP